MVLGRKGRYKAERWDKDHEDAWYAYVHLVKAIKSTRSLCLPALRQPTSDRRMD